MYGVAKVADLVNVPAVKFNSDFPFEIIALLMCVLFVEKALYDEPKRQLPPEVR